MARAELLASEQAAALQHRLKFGATKLSCNLEDTVIAVDVSPDGEYFAAGGLKEVAVARFTFGSAIGSLKFTYGPRTSPLESEDGMPRRTLARSMPPRSNSAGSALKSSQGSGELTRALSRMALHKESSTDSMARKEAAVSRPAAAGGVSRSLKLVISTFAKGAADNIHIVDVLSKVELGAAIFSHDGKARNVQTSAIVKSAKILAVGGASPSVHVYTVWSASLPNQTAVQAAALAANERERGERGNAFPEVGNGGSVHSASETIASTSTLSSGLAEPLFKGAVVLKLQLTVPSKCNQVEAVSLDAAGTLLGIAGDSRRVELWSLMPDRHGELNGAMVYQFNCHVGVFGLAISQDGKLIAAGTSKRTEVWRVRKEASFGAVALPVHGSRSAVLAQRLGTLAHTRWEAASKHVRAARLLSEGSCQSLPGSGRSPQLDGRHRCATSNELLSKKSWRAGVKPWLEGAEKPKSRVASSLSRSTPAHNRWSSASGGWASAGSSGVFRQQPQAQLTSGANSSTGSLLVRQTPLLHPRVECEPLHVFEQPTPQGGVAFSADASRLVIGGDQLVTLHDVQTGSELRTFRQNGRVRCVALCEQGVEVVSGGFDKHVSLCCAEAGAAMSSLSTRDRLVVKCIDVQGTLVALGGQSGQGGRGLAQLFDTSKGRDTSKELRCVHQWERDAEVRCVRLTAAKSLLAIAGHDFLVRLMCTVTYAQLCELNYAASTGPPRFIWSLDISRDLEVMAVGCWSSKVHIYKLGKIDEVQRAGDEQAMAEQMPGAPAAADEIAPRPAGAASFLPRAPIRPTEITVIPRGDRVYSVALDELGHKLLVGGRDKRAAMYDLSETLSAKQSDGKLREPPLPMWEELSDEFIYSVALARNFTTCAIGGMSKTVRLLAAQNKHQLCEIAVPGTVHCVSVQDDGSKFAVSGELPTLTVYDRRGNEIVCLPSADDVYGVALTSSSLAFTKQRAAMLYGRAGGSYGWQDQPSWEMAANILRDSSEKSMYSFLRCVLSEHPSLVNSRSSKDGSSFLQHIVCISRDPDIIDLVLGAETAIGLLPDLTLTTALHLAVETGNRTAIKRILRANLHGKLSSSIGTMRQVFSCFELIAKRYPHDFLEYISKLPLESEPEVLDLDDTADVVLPGGRVLVKGHHKRYPRRLWAKTIAKYRTVIDLSAASADGASDRSDSNEPGRFSDDDADDFLETPNTTRQLRGSVGASPPSKPQHAHANSQPREPPLDQGISSVTHASAFGLRAMRIPFPHFGGMGGAKRTVSVSPLQLISQAARATGDYKVFGATIVEATLQHKWGTFARRQFYQDLALYLAKMMVIYVHVLYVLFPPEFNGEANPIIGIAWDTVIAGPRANALIVTWTLTTAFAIHDEYNEVRQMRVTGLDYFGIWNGVDQVFICSTVASNIVFLVAALSAGAGVTPNPNAGPNLGGIEPLFQILSPLMLPPESLEMGEEVASGFTGGLGDLGDENAVVFTNESTWVMIIAVCEALVLLSVHIKLLYYARGFQKLGVLVRMIIQIMGDMLSFLLVLLVILLGFGLSIYLLRRHSYALGATSVVLAIFDIADAGLYGVMRDDKSEYTNAGVVQLVIFAAFLVVTQVVLLNLLIAIMSDSYAKVRGQAELAAKYELAQVMQEVEDSPPFIERLISIVPSWRTPEHDKFPRWLHVLLPESEALAVPAPGGHQGQGQPPIDLTAQGMPSGAGGGQTGSGGGGAAGGSQRHKGGGSITTDQRLETLEDKLDELLLKEQRLESLENKLDTLISEGRMSARKEHGSMRISATPPMPPARRSSRDISRDGVMRAHSSPTADWLSWLRPGSSVGMSNEPSPTSPKLQQPQTEPPKASVHHRQPPSPLSNRERESRLDC